MTKNNSAFRAFGAALFLSACAISGYTTAGYASETKTVSRTVTVYDLADTGKFGETVLAICNDKDSKLSDKARIACNSGKFPQITKALVFRNAGVGAELNTLVRIH